MSSPSFFSDGSTPRRSDARWTILQKILGAINDNGSGGGSGVAGSVARQVYDGSGAPGALVPFNPAITAQYTDNDTGIQYTWAGGAWS